MLNNLNIYKPILFIGFVLLLLFSCGGSDDGQDSTIIGGGQENVIPSNLSLQITIQGKDENNLEGDGSGKIELNASANDAVRYEFKIGTDDLIESTSGLIDYTCTKTGNNSLFVSVYAYSSTNDYVFTSETIKVYVTPIVYDELIFFDEFDTNGSPDDSKWDYNIGRGDNGWGNGESQYYTSRTDNVIIEDDLLKIIAKKEDYEGAKYTSTRMLTQGKFDFTYGRVEVRAKLPIGVGTWPAIWLLGSNISTVSWPACGEIDIMEHWGDNQGVVQSALHTPSSYGATTNHGSQYIEDVSSEFHVYEVYWTHEEIVFSVDGVQHYRYAPGNKNDETWPYDANQFLILNVALGSSWMTIDPDFVQSTMEIDYVRVYQ